MNLPAPKHSVLVGIPCSPQATHSWGRHNGAHRPGEGFLISTSSWLPLIPPQETSSSYFPRTFLVLVLQVPRPRGCARQIGTVDHSVFTQACSGPRRFAHYVCCCCQSCSPEVCLQVLLPWDTAKEGVVLNLRSPGDPKVSLPSPLSPHFHVFKLSFQLDISHHLFNEQWLSWDRKNTKFRQPLLSFQ